MSEACERRRVRESAVGQTRSCGDGVSRRDAVVAAAGRASRATASIRFVLKIKGRGARTFSPPELRLWLHKNTVPQREVLVGCAQALSARVRCFCGVLAAEVLFVVMLSGEMCWCSSKHPSR